MLESQIQKKESAAPALGLADWAGILLAMTLWGLAWPIGKIAAQYLAPVQFNFFRFMVSSFVLIVWCYFARVRLAPERLSGWWPPVVAGLCLFIYNHGFMSGLKSGLAGAGGVLVTTVSPVLTWVLIQALGIARRPWGARSACGLTLGVAGGAILLAWGRFAVTNSPSGGEITSGIYFFMSAIAWALITILATRSTVGGLAFTAHTYWVCSAINLPFALDLPTPAPPPAEFWYAFLFMAVIASAVATGTYFQLAQRIGAERTASFTFFVPGTALISSAIIFDESLEAITLLGGGLAACGAYLLATSSRKLDKSE